MSVLPFYNPCATCGNDELQLVDDAEHRLSKTGGIRLVCVKCGRNTEPTVWNEYNKPAQKEEEHDTERTD